MQIQIESLITYFKVNKISFIGPSSIYIKNALRPLIHINYWSLPKDFNSIPDVFNKFQCIDDFYVPVKELMQKAKISENDYLGLLKANTYRFFSISIKLSDFYQKHDFKEDYLNVCILLFKKNQYQVLFNLSNEYVNFISDTVNFKLPEEFKQKQCILIERYLSEIITDILLKLNAKKEKVRKKIYVKFIIENMVPKLEESKVAWLLKKHEYTLKNPQKFISWLVKKGYLDELEIEDVYVDFDRINYEFFRHYVLNYEDDWKIDVDHLKQFIFEQSGIQIEETIPEISDINAILKENNLQLMQLESGFDRYNLVIVNKHKKDEILKVSKKMKIPLYEI